MVHASTVDLLVCSPTLPSYDVTNTLVTRAMYMQCATWIFRSSHASYCQNFMVTPQDMDPTYRPENDLAQQGRPSYIDHSLCEQASY